MQNGDELSSTQLTQLSEQASSAATPPAQLADLAYRYPQLRVQIAANPAAYPGLLDWLEAQGDPAVSAAIKARVPAPPAPPAPVPPPAPPVSEPPAAAEPSAASAQTPVAPVPPPPGAVPPAGGRGGRIFGGMSRKLLIGLAAGSVVLLVLVGGGVFALTNFLTGGFASATDSAKAFPASTYAWAEIAIDPSPNQKLGAAELLGNLPELADYLEEFGPDLDYSDLAESADLKEAAWDFLVEALAGYESPLDFEDDVAPWLGSRVAFGLVAAESHYHSAIVAVQASDTAAGVEAIEELLDETDRSAVQVFARNGYVVLAHEELNAEQAYAKGSLADTSAMKAFTPKIGEWGLATVWFSPRAAVDANFAWAEQAYEEGAESLSSIEERYRTLYNDWSEEAAQYDYLCPASGEWLSYDCYWMSPPSAETFYYSNGFYPEDWQDAANDEYDGAQERHAKVVDSVEKVRELLPEQGSMGAVLRITDASLEMVSLNSDLGLPEVENPRHVGELAALPETTVAAFSVSQIGSLFDLVLSPEYFAAGFASTLSSQAFASPYTFESLVSYEGEAFPDLVETQRDGVAEWFDQELGWDFPEDLAKLFGTNTMFVVDEDMACDLNYLAYADYGCEDPGLGFLIFSDDADETEDFIDDILDEADRSYGDVGVDVKADGGKVIVARGEYGEELLAGGGSLGQQPGFATALPDLNGAFLASYVNVEALLEIIEDQYRDQYGYPTEMLEMLEKLEGVAAVGFTASKSGGDVIARFRISTVSG